MTTTSDTIRDLLAECISAARAQGYKGTDAEYEHTREDLEFVTDTIGRKPSRDEWADAGLRYVGDSHVADDAE